MREIKFRAWDSTSKRIYSLPEIREMDLLQLARGDTPYTKFMQYTGLKDKNGKEIYEGDVVRFESHRGYTIEDFIGQVVWITAGWGVEYDSKFGKGWSLGFQIPDELKEDMLDHLEIIGNIYENPDLLTPQQERGTNE